jgi:DNA replication protein DnaC
VRARLAQFDALQIPARMADTERSTFQPVGKEAMQLLSASSQWMDAFDPATRDQGLILYGDVGRGKTHILVGLLRELVMQHGVHARFIEFSHLLNELKHGFDKGEGASQRIEPLIAADVLGIDELGKGRATEFEMAVVDELVTRRYNAGRTILATTNYYPGPPTGRHAANLADAAGTQPRLADRVGERVYSRLRETCSFVHVGGDDFRERLHAR